MAVKLSTPLTISRRHQAGGRGRTRTPSRPALPMTSLAPHSPRRHGGHPWLHKEVDGTPGAGQFRVRSPSSREPLRRRITFSEADAGKSVAVNYHACGTLIWAEDRGKADARCRRSWSASRRLGALTTPGAVVSSHRRTSRPPWSALAGVRIVKELNSNLHSTCGGRMDCSYATSASGAFDRSWGHHYAGSTGGRR